MNTGILFGIGLIAVLTFLHVKEGGNRWTLFLAAFLGTVGGVIQNELEHRDLFFHPIARILVSALIVWFIAALFVKLGWLSEFEKKLRRKHQ